MMLRDSDPLPFFLYFNLINPTVRYQLDQLLDVIQVHWFSRAS
jgi:hypothetical protein